MTEHNEDRRQLDDSKTNLPELTGALEEVTGAEARAAAKIRILDAQLKRKREIDAALTRMETSVKANAAQTKKINRKVSQGIANLDKKAADWQKGRSQQLKDILAKYPDRQLRSTSKGTTAVKKSMPASTSWAKNAFKTVGRAAMGPWALGASIFLDPTSTGGEKIAFKYSGRKGKYDAMFPPEKVIRSDENVPLNIPSDKELGRIYNKNVADYEKKNQQLKRKQPAAEPDVEPEIYFANLPAKREADLAAARSARNKR